MNRELRNIDLWVLKSATTSKRLRVLTEIHLNLECTIHIEKWLVSFKIWDNIQSLTLTCADTTGSFLNHLPTFYLWWQFWCEEGKDPCAGLEQSVTFRFQNFSSFLVGITATSLWWLLANPAWLWGTNQKRDWLRSSKYQHYHLQHISHLMLIQPPLP